jgi:hypothetical protein
VSTPYAGRFPAVHGSALGKASGRAAYDTVLRPSTADSLALALPGAGDLRLRIQLPPTSKQRRFKPPPDANTLFSLLFPSTSACALYPPSARYRPRINNQSKLDEEPPAAPHCCSLPCVTQMSWDLLQRFLESDVFNSNPFLSVSYLS